jgi:hypothetical protein
LSSSQTLVRTDEISSRKFGQILGGDEGASHPGTPPDLINLKAGELNTQYEVIFNFLCKEDH